MSVWYFSKALIKAPQPVLTKILDSKEPNSKILFTSQSLALLEEYGRWEGLSDWTYRIGLREPRTIVFVRWCVEADAGGVWAMRAGRMVHRKAYDYQGSPPPPDPVTDIQKWAQALELELETLEAASKTAVASE